MTKPAPDLSRLRIDRDAPSGGADHRLRRAVWINGGIAFGALILIGGGYLLFGRDGPVAVDTAVASVTGGAAGAAGSTAVTANGYVVARTRASVSSKVPGRLIELRVSEGSFARKGEVIARLESADYAAQVAQAEAQVRGARATLVESQASRDQLVREAGRAREINTRSPELISAQEVEAAVSRAAQAEARVRADSAGIAAAEAALQFARVNLENTLIRAPFTGTVLRKDAEVGEVVAPSVGGGLTRGAVVTMADLATLEVEVDVNEAYINRVQAAQPAEAVLNAYPDWRIPAHVIAIIPTADRARATVKVRVALDERDERTAERRVPGHRRAVNATAHDHDVELAVRQRGQVSLHAVLTGRRSYTIAWPIMGLAGRAPCTLHLQPTALKPFSLRSSPRSRRTGIIASTTSR